MPAVLERVFRGFVAAILLSSRSKVGLTGKVQANTGNVKLFYCKKRQIEELLFWQVLQKFVSYAKAKNIWFLSKILIELSEADTVAGINRKLAQINTYI